MPCFGSLKESAVIRASSQRCRTEAGSMKMAEMRCSSASMLAGKVRPGAVVTGLARDGSGCGAKPSSGGGTSCPAPFLSRRKNTEIRLTIRFRRERAIVVEKHLIVGFVPHECGGLHAVARQCEAVATERMPHRVIVPARNPLTAFVLLPEAGELCEFREALHVIGYVRIAC